jgi:hypothetical protein
VTPELIAVIEEVPIRAALKLAQSLQTTSATEACGATRALITRHFASRGTRMNASLCRIIDEAELETATNEWLEFRSHETMIETAGKELYYGIDCVRDER